MPVYLAPDAGTVPQGTAAPAPGLGTPTALWTEAPGLAVEVMLSPDYAGRLGGKGTERELRRIVEGLEPTG
ncbi:hypothetical protein [Planomonospora sphaerica]|uniref:hypothetical protein n=1 Tax=Planomonospora sphaerica TaxID=161355 RepID=UPI00129020B0|nr:hypothetical protein [Planomonospora sphaerica]